MMTIRGKLCLSAAAIGIAVLAAAPFSRLSAQQPSSPPGVTVGQNDLGGIVSGAGGPEAGVWVIAETTDLPTKFAKIVVTDDQGRYLMPDLPKANYSVWVRGYGLVDSPKVAGRRRAASLNLTPWPRRARRRPRNTIPPIYWYSMLNVPAKSEFPHGEDQEPGRVAQHRQDRRLQVVPRARHAGHADDLAGARRSSRPPPTHGRAACSPGSAQMFMIRDITRLDTPRALALFADWTDRIAAGELPFAKPARPQGIERNVVHHAVGLGQPRRPICTTRSRPTGATRASTPTARSTARPRTAPTSCRCSIR